MSRATCTAWRNSADVSASVWTSRSAVNISCGVWPATAAAVADQLGKAQSLRQASVCATIHTANLPPTFTGNPCTTGHARAGYGGDLTPNPDCIAINLLVTLQTIASLLLDYSLLGLVYARFSSPTNRIASTRFSHNLYMGLDGERLVLSARVSNVRRQTVLNPSVRLLLALEAAPREGEAAPGRGDDEGVPLCLMVRVRLCTQMKTAIVAKRSMVPARRVGLLPLAPALRGKHSMVAGRCDTRRAPCSACSVQRGAVHGHSGAAPPSQHKELKMHIMCSAHHCQ